MPSPIKAVDTDGRFYVRIKYNVWPEIYGKQLPFHFPDRESALRFAQFNCSANKPLTRVYSPDGRLIRKFVYEQPPAVLPTGHRKLKRRAS